MLNKFKNKNQTIVIVLIILGAFLHFYNLNWGAPFYFHPDERNIASSVSQIHFPNQMNPHFFAYGSLPIYIIYFTGEILQFFYKSPVHIDPFILAIQISRFYSALFATLLIPIMFVIVRSIVLKQSHTSQNANIIGVIAALLTATSVGFIQFAHFGTFEMWLTFFSVLLFWICLQPFTKKKVLFIGLLFGALVAIKVSSLVLLPILLLVPFLSFLAESKNLHSLRLVGMAIFKMLAAICSLLIISFLIYSLTNPFVFLDTKSFLDSMHYESTLAIGTLPVFYTAEFFNTLPIIFQFIKIYPFLLNPLITILFIPSFIYLSYIAIKTKNKSHIILTTFYLLLFLSQAFLFAKWTRYMVPTLPFIFLIIAIALHDFLKNKKQQYSNITIITIALLNSLFAFSYFITAFVQPDTRIQAYNIAQKTIPSNAPMITEVYDMGIVPFNQIYTNIQLFNFYDLDNKSPDATPEKLHEFLTKSDYIILPSQRIIKPRLLQQNRFPQGNKFYQDLIDGKLGFQKIYQTPCDFFCQITYLGSPVWSFEETANVFDRPTIMIFKKYNNK